MEGRISEENFKPVFPGQLVHFAVLQLGGIHLDVVKAVTGCCQAPPFPPKEYAGFSQCRIGLSADGRLLSLQPFTGEAESTEWYPGVLAYSPAFPL